MTAISTDDALRDLCTGYCLWVGAGVAMHVGHAASAPVPGWPEVVCDLERAAGLTPPSAAIPYADRIERCLRALRRLDFQRQLRAAIVRPMAEAIVKLANDHTDSRPCIPRAIRQLAHLGALANPIVNFNVDTTTSRLVADPSGRSNVRCFAPPLPGATTLLRQQRAQTMVFRRNVYHPHGAIDDSGICIMASSEYESMRGTLGLQIALHNAFESKLAIVGMSLEDAYLREQIRSFRSQIDTIYWFMDAPSDEDKSWAWANNVTIVQQPWAVFWERAEDILPCPIREECLYQTWLIAVGEAFKECSGRQPTSRYVAVRLNGMTSRGEDVPPAVLDEWRWLAKLQGEDGDEKMTLGESIEPPEQAKAAVGAIHRGFDSARRIDSFCREVAESDAVFFAWEKSDSILSIHAVRSAREFWSSEDLATAAITKSKPDPSKFRAAPMPWRGLVSQWRDEGSLSSSIQVNESGDPTAALNVPASRIIGQIEGLRSL
jgi:SIR2-like protein